MRVERVQGFEVARAACVGGRCGEGGPRHELDGAVACREKNVIARVGEGDLVRLHGLGVPREDAGGASVDGEEDVVA